MHNNPVISKTIQSGNTTD